MFRKFTKAAWIGRRFAHSVVPSSRLPPKLTSTLENIDPCMVTTLENGLRIATQQTNYPTGTVGVYIDSGTSYETPGFHGASNMIEHLLFRGTKKRSGEQIRDELAKLGVTASINTSREICAVESRCLAKDVAKVIDILGDVVCNVQFKEEDLDGEKDIVMRRIQNRTYQCRDIVMDYIHHGSFLGTPLQNNVIGLSDTVLTMTPEDLHKYHRDKWIATNTVLVAVGPFDHDQIVELAQKHFANQPSKPIGEYPYKGTLRFTPAEMEYRDDSFPMIYFAMAFEGMGFSHRDKLPMDVVSCITGSYDRSEDLQGQDCMFWKDEMKNTRRFEGAVRVYVCDFFNINYRDNGIWGVYIECDDLDFMAHGVQQKIFRTEWCRLAIGPADEEVELGKEILKCRVIREETSNGSLSLAKQIGREVTYTGYKKSLLQRVEDIENVTTADIRDVMDRRFYDEDFSVGTYGRASAMPDIANSRTYTSRWIY